MFRRKRHPEPPAPRFKRADQLSLSDAIAMPSGRAYAVRSLEWSGMTINIECAEGST